MANIVINTFTVTGPEEKIKNFLQDANKDEQGRLMLSSWFNIPKGITDKEFRKLCLENFSVKCNCEIKIEERKVFTIFENRKEGQVQMCVETPLKEPETFFELMSYRYYNLVFKNYAFYVDKKKYTIAEYINEDRILIEEWEDDNDRIGGFVLD